MAYQDHQPTIQNTEQNMTESRYFQFPDVNAWATMTAREVTNAKTVNVSRSLSLIPLFPVILMMTSAANVSIVLSLVS